MEALGTWLELFFNLADSFRFLEIPKMIIVFAESRVIVLLTFMVVQKHKGLFLLIAVVSLCYDIMLLNSRNFPLITWKSN